MRISVITTDEDPSIGTTTFRAVLDLHAHTLTLYPKSGEHQEVVLSHETFHALCPEVSGTHAEVCANLFATLALGLNRYVGLLDTSD